MHYIFTLSNFRINNCTAHSIIEFTSYLTKEIGEGNNWKWATIIIDYTHTILLFKKYLSWLYIIFYRGKNEMFKNGVSLNIHFKFFLIHENTDNSAIKK